MPKTCGDNGGVTASGTPCDRAAGWGVEGEDEGRCKQHRDQSDSVELSRPGDESGSRSDPQENSSNPEKNSLADSNGDWKSGCLGFFLIILLIGGLPYILAFVFMIPLFVLALLLLSPILALPGYFLYLILKS